MLKKLYIIELSIVLALLNVCDAIFTNYGLSKNYIDELNPLMKQLTNFSPILFLLSKFFLSFMIVYIAYRIYRYGSAHFKKWFYLALFAVCILYTGIFSMHLIWLSYV